MSQPTFRTLEFPAGVLGFPGAQRFTLARVEGTQTFRLESLEVAGLAFTVADPADLGEGDVVELDDDALGPLAGVPREQLQVLAIVTPPRWRGDHPTVNLKAPLVIHTGRGVGLQVVLEAPEKEARHPVEASIGITAA